MKISNKCLSLSVVLAMASVSASPLYAGSYFGKNKTPKTEETTPAEAAAQGAPEVMVDEVVVSEVPVSAIEEAQMEAPTEAENLDPSQGTSAS